MKPEEFRIDIDKDFERDALLSPSTIRTSELLLVVMEPEQRCAGPGQIRADRPGPDPIWPEKYPGI